MKAGLERDAVPRDTRSGPRLHTDVARICRSNVTRNSRSSSPRRRPHGRTSCKAPRVPGPRCRVRELLRAPQPLPLPSAPCRVSADVTAWPPVAKHLSHDFPRDHRPILADHVAHATFDLEERRADPIVVVEANPQLDAVLESGRGLAVEKQIGRIEVETHHRLTRNRTRPIVRGRAEITAQETGDRPGPRLLDDVLQLVSPTITHGSSAVAVRLPRLGTWPRKTNATPLKSVAKRNSRSQILMQPLGGYVRRVCPWCHPPASWHRHVVP